MYNVGTPWGWYMFIDTCTTYYIINIANKNMYYALTILVEKTESMAFKWRDPVRNKICIG
jgi:hypothetical protein